MGTHPIFESDFDCLTEIVVMDNQLGSSTQFAFISSLSVILPRFLSFFLKGILIRNVGAAFLGLVFVRLELLSTTILFCSRELIRRSVTGEALFRHSVNLTWLFLPIGALIGSIFVSSWIYLETGVDGYSLACVLIGLSALLQMFEEPVYYLSTRRLSAKNKSLSEAAMLVTRSMLYFACSINEPTIVKFAMCHCVASLVCSTLHWFLWLRELSDITIGDLLPGADEAGAFFDRVQLARLKDFFLLNFSKQLLTEGERYVVTFLGLLTLEAQGQWDSITALGALFPRFLFRPLEESFAIHFRDATPGMNN